MASKQVVIAYRDSFGYGWSEKYYFSGPVALGVLPPDVFNLLNQRMPLSGSDVTATHVRIQGPNKRDPFIYTLNGGAGFPGGQPRPTSPAEVAILVRAEGVGQGYNRVFIRGIPEAVVQGDTYQPPAGYDALMTAFLRAWRDPGTFNVQGTLGSPPAHNSATNLIGNPPRGYTFSSVVPANVGDVIRMHGAQVPGYNGLKTVVQKIGTGPYILAVGGAAPPAADPNTGSQYWTAINRYDNVISDAFPEGLTRRAAGRPFGLSRGRRPTLYSLRR